MNTRRNLLADPLQDVTGPVGPAPMRRAASIRRTSSLDGSWPGGWGTQMRLDGRARDAVTHSSADAPIVISTHDLSIGLGDNRMIEDIAATPDVDGIQNLVGCRGGGYLRAALAEFIPDHLAGGTPLYLLLDDISGASLVAGVSWSRWAPERTRAAREAFGRHDMEGVCIGFATGSSALVEIRSGESMPRAQIVGPLVNPSDPTGWHTLDEQPEVCFRRARRIDVWRDPVDGVIQIDSGFQDSTSTPDHERVAIHEYSLRATADPQTLDVTSVTPTAHVLPFRSCPAAIATAQAIVGTPLAELRSTVLERLSRDGGCTHLNDAMRALAEVPVLLDDLDRALAD